MRSAVPGILRDRPPVRFGSSLTSADTYLPACCHVSVRAKHGLSPSPDHLPSPYPGSSSRLRFICPHKHMIVRRPCSRHTNPATSRQARPPMAAALLGRYLVEAVGVSQPLFG